MISEEMEQLVKLFDFALSSDNPAVKKALKNLLLLVSIIEPEEENHRPGPLRSLQDEIMKLRTEILRLSNDMSLIKEHNRISRTTPYMPSVPGTYPGTYPTTYPTTYPNSWTITTSTPTSSSITSVVASKGLASMSVSIPDTDNLSDLIQEYKNNIKDNNKI